MRTTVTLDDHAAAAVERIRRETGIGVSEAVNRLIRAGLLAPREPATYTHTTAPLGLKIDVANVGEALELLDD